MADNIFQKIYRGAQELFSKDNDNFQGHTVVPKKDLSNLSRILTGAETESELQSKWTQVGNPFNGLDASNMNANPHSSFVQDWSANYQTEKDPVKERRARATLESDWEVPEDAKGPLDKASTIFEGDSGFTKDELYKYGANTGQIESGYKTRVQNGGGPARSYWQVEPDTALDLLTNSSSLFGPKFEKMFSGKYGSENMSAREGLSLMSADEMSKILEEDDDLGATFSLGTYVRSRQS